MTKDEKYHAGVVEGGLMLLLEAVQRQDPTREIIVCVKDLLFDIQKLTKPQR